ncbi:MAG: hypothetical protein LUQ65_03765 [Candidatus Helarchaeota archaeon]|nr:hypothetical protein [Candidatus Helarchaeota archaeon]
MNLFKILAITVLALNLSLIPIYLFIYYNGIPHYGLLWTAYLIASYGGVISLIFFVCITATRIRSGFQGTRLMIGNRHLHEGTIGIIFVLTGVIWNLWHFFDENFYFPYREYATVGWWLAVSGLVFIVLGAILIGRDWEDIKSFRFFNKEDEKPAN